MSSKLSKFSLFNSPLASLAFPLSLTMLILRLSLNFLEFFQLPPRRKPKEEKLGVL